MKFEPNVDFTRKTSLSFSQQSINTILHPMEEIQQGSVQDGDTSCNNDKSLSKDWTISRSMLLAHHHQEYLNINDGQLDVPTLSEFPSIPRENKANP